MVAVGPLNDNFLKCLYINNWIYVNYLNEVTGLGNAK